MKAAIVGGAGYAGGELLRLLLSHPEVEVTQVTSERLGGKFVHTVHPHLRRRTELKFQSRASLQPVDVLFIALPHGETSKEIDRLQTVAPTIIDLSADFRLRDRAGYPTWYGWEHPQPSLLDDFVYALPELHREQIRSANRLAARGILTTAHVFLTDDLSEKDLWKIYRAAYADEPFMRIIKESQGIHRYPNPKILSGTNYCDVGFERDPHSRRVVVMSALDNLMKGAAGQAVQALNVRFGWEERTGLDFPGLYPI